MCDTLCICVVYIYIGIYIYRPEVMYANIDENGIFFLPKLPGFSFMEAFFFFRRIFFGEKRPFLAKKRPKNVLFLNIKFSKQDMIYTFTTICQCSKKTQKKSSRSLTGTFFENLFNQ